MRTQALANWYGRDGAVVDRVAELLDGCRWIGVPFAGGMGVLASLRCNQGVAGDLHRHVINLARVMASPFRRDQMLDQLATLPLHSDALERARRVCAERERAEAEGLPTDLFGQPVRGGYVERCDVEWAAAYFTLSWMSRAGASGTKDEFAPATMSLRWSASGGGSSQRWRSAVEGIPEWDDVLNRWAFIVADVFDFLANVTDLAENGLYLDPTFPVVGDGYQHVLTMAQHKQLVKKLLGFATTRIVVRFHDAPVIRELYADPRWKVVELRGGRRRMKSAMSCCWC